MTLSHSPKCQDLTGQKQSSLIFRDATINDAKFLNELYNAAIGEETSLEWDKERSLAETEEYLSKMINTRYPCILVFEAEELVAFGALERFTVGDEGGTSFFTARVSIVVARLYRRNGLATTLWNRLVDHNLTTERNLYTIFSQVLTCNTAAIALLRTLGFGFKGQLEHIATKQGRPCSHTFWIRNVGTQPGQEMISKMGFPKDNPLELVKSVDIVPSAVLIREATLADCQFITTTYNDIALSTSAVEYMEERDLKEKEKWLADLIVEGWVCLIAEMEGIPVGFLSFESYAHEDQCFRHVGYICAFMQPLARRRGVGELLFTQLLRHQVMQRKEIKYIIAGYSLQLFEVSWLNPQLDLHTINAGAVRGALKAGFTHEVTLEKLNVKFGEWIDCSWWIKPLQDKRQRRCS